MGDQQILGLLRTKRRQVHTAATNSRTTQHIFPQSRSLRLPSRSPPHALIVTNALSCCRLSAQNPQLSAQNSRFYSAKPLIGKELNRQESEKHPPLPPPHAIDSPIHHLFAKSPTHRQQHPPGAHRHPASR